MITVGNNCDEVQIRGAHACSTGQGGKILHVRSVVGQPPDSGWDRYGTARERPRNSATTSPPGMRTVTS